MIIVLTLMIANITQTYYNNLINPIDTLLLACPSCGKTGMNIHGYYRRQIKNQNFSDKQSLKIRRVICCNEDCRCTHALLPSSIVPYSQISMIETMSIIDACSVQEREDIMKQNPLIDHSDILAIIRNFKSKWLQRLSQITASMGDGSFFKECISVFGVHFMQMPDTICGSYSCHHTIHLALHLG